MVVSSSRSSGRSRIADGNEAAASVAYRLNETAAIYPITPSSPMGELADEWAAKGRTNVWGTVPRIVEMQSEGGAAGAVHGALQAGSLATTFTASQGLLLMMPNMFKIAGELTPFVMHVAARSVATHALSIFGDHSDVMATRMTGFALLAAANVQEAHDLACVAQMASLASRVPFVHFFDGFRTSHELVRIDELSDDDLRALVDEELVQAHRDRALSPDRPSVRGTAQNPDAFFQAREAANPFYDACPAAVETALERFAARTGRAYELFDYFGDPQADRVLVMMGSGAGAAQEAVDRLVSEGERVGLVVVRLYRPFSAAHLLAALPDTADRVAVLDRTKEPGALADPLHLDVLGALAESDRDSRVIGGRYGLSSKEFTPTMAKAVLDELKKDEPKPRFTIGIVDDVTRLSLDYDPTWTTEPKDVVKAVFFGLGSDGTVGANKSSIEILGSETELYAQGYFVYDSKKAGAVTVSHLRFGPRPIRSSYLIARADFVACHQFSLLDRLEVVESARQGATLLLNAPFEPGEVWRNLPREVQDEIIARELKVYTVDAGAVARDAGLGGRINTVMQACFFAISGVLPRDRALECIRRSIAKKYGRKGEEVVRRNLDALDVSLDHLYAVEVPREAEATRHRPPSVPDEAPDFVQRVTAVLLAGQGDLLPVSAFPVDGSWPTGTARWEKRGIAWSVPIWDTDVCIQCNKCTLACPHAAIRAKVYEPAALGDGAPEGFPHAEFRSKEMPGLEYSLQVAPEDCTGCGLCVAVCPAKNKANPKDKAIVMQPLGDVVERERERYAFFLDLPELDRTAFERFDVKTSQLLLPLFEYSGACAGCGETPYVKLLTQLYGDRILIANATGCSSIYGGNLPTTPYTTDSHGRGPAWSNSLFEDNAEFGLGFRLAVLGLRDRAEMLVRRLAGKLGDGLAGELLAREEKSERGLAQRRELVLELRKRLAAVQDADARRLEACADALVRKSVWIVGGDGWAFDIGYGGLDHVLASGHDVNVLVLDTEVYSNTGGQASKATPLGAAAKFASRGKAIDKKDLGLMAVSYGNVYVASIAFGAKDAQTVTALQEADSYDGPSLVIAYSHCVAHGYDMVYGADQQKRAVDSGVWPLFRYDPRRAEKGEAPLVVDAKGGRSPAAEYMRNEARFRMVEKIDPDAFRRYAAGAQHAAERRIAVYQHMAALRFPAAASAHEPAETTR